MAEIQNLEFNINVNVSKDASKVGALARNIERLKQVCDSFNGSSIDNVKKYIQSFNDLGKANISPNIARQINNIVNSARGLGRLETSKLDAFANSLRSLNSVQGLTISSTIAKQLPEIAKAMDSITQGHIDKMRELGDALKGFQGLGNITVGGLRAIQQMADQQQTSSVEEAVQRFGTDMSRYENIPLSENSISDRFIEQTQMIGESLSNARATISSFVSEARERISSIATGIQSAFSRVGGIITRALSPFMRMGSLLRPAFAPFAEMGSRITGLAGGFTRLASSMGRILMYRVIRSIISGITKALGEGVKNLYNYSQAVGTTFASAMDSISTSANYAKNSLGAMAGPLLETLAPAIDVVVDKFVALVNIVNMFISALTGAATFTVAKKIATGFDAAGNSASGASGKVKELKKTLLGFDEINKLNDNDQSSGGGGGGKGGGALATEMFESANITDGIKDFVEQLKSAFNDQRWEDLGSLIGGKLNEIVNSINWKEMGQKVGTAFSGVFSTLDSIVSTFDFENLGNKLGTFVNGALQKMLDVVNGGEHNGFYHLGHLISTWFLALPETIIGFIETLDFGMVAQAISDTLVGYINGFTDFLKGIDWNNLGHKVVQGIVDFFANAKYAEIAQSIGTFLGTAVGAAVNFIGGAISEFGSSVVTKINEYFKGKIDECGGNVIEGFLKGIKDAIVGIGTWVSTNIVDPFIKAVKDMLGIHSPSTVMKEIGGYVMEGFLNGIKEFFSDPLGWVKEHIVDPIKNAITNNPISDAIEATVSLGKKGWDTVTDWIKKGANFGTGVIEKAVSLIKDGWTTVKSWISGASNLGSGTVDKAVGLVKDSWSSVKSWISDNFMGNGSVAKGVSLKREGNLHNTSVGGVVNKYWLGKGSVVKGVSLKKDGNLKNTTVGGVVNKYWSGSSTVGKGVSLFRGGNLSGTSVSGVINRDWSGDSSVWKGVDLFRNYWDTVSEYVWAHRGDNTVSMGISLYIASFDGPGFKSGFRYPVYKGGIITQTGIDYFANGGTPNHGTMFVAGEAGAEIVGNIGGRSEVLNRSQLASTMYQAVYSGIRATLGYSANVEAQAMEEYYRMAEEQNSLIREQNELLRQINEKEFGNEITANSVRKALTRTNKRVGKTVVALD